MIRRLVTPVAVTIFGALLVGGCAKQQLVKKDEPLPSAAATAGTATPPSSQAGSAAGLRTEPLREEKVAQASPASAAVSSAAAVPTLALEKIFFDFDAATLSATARETLAKDAAMIKKATPVKIVIEGNCDERGSDEYNLALGEKRAAAARQYLVTLGVAPERLSVISYGKERPAVQGHDEIAWSKNRRDEFVVSAK